MQPRSATPTWKPEDPDFWDRHGRAIALRNLGFAIPALALSFAVWLLWSVLVVHLPAAGFRYSTNQLFWLSALPAICGATLRIFYGFAVPLVGGRRWTALSTASLLIPATGIGFAVQDPATPYEWMVMLALLCGLGGANFASGMAHISACFPAREQGRALGVGAGFAHLGVGLVQWAVPTVIAFDLFGLPAQGDGALWLANAGFVWLPLIAASSVTAWFGMNDFAFTGAGLANGSTFRMIPLGFLRDAQASHTKRPEAIAQGAAALGLCSAVGAYGGFFIPKSFGSAIALTGDPTAALLCFLAFYGSCIGICWWFYARRNAPLSC